MSGVEGWPLNSVDEDVDERSSFFLLFPAAVAILISILPFSGLRSAIVRISGIIIAAASVYLAYCYFGHGTQFFQAEFPGLEKMFFAGEMVLTLFLLYKCIGIKRKEIYIPILLVLQAGIMIFLELGKGLPKVENPLYIDNFSIIMGLIIGVIGSLICIYAISYMKEYHRHHPEMKDRQRSFFFILFLFLSAMFGVVFANNLVWLFFFWEVTTLSSFILIGYPKTEEATRNAYLALGLNLLGGLGFSLAILYLVKFSPEKTIDLSRIISLGSTVMLVPVMLISFAGLTKSAQMPFSKWLLGAMVAPTPVSALLHSSTMVKAGIFIIIKFAPVLHGTWAGLFLALIGGVTFLMTSIIAVTQSNAKRVLAYSTIANLGLIVACAGIGTNQTLWAAILLTIFHAVSKGLLFLGVGSIEHKIGSRDIEDMDGLIVARPGLAIVMLIGILGMFLAPFGMLISKWACLEAFINSSPIVAVLLAFGSAPTLFFWTKWMGKIVSVSTGQTKGQGSVSGDEWSCSRHTFRSHRADCRAFPGCFIDVGRALYTGDIRPGSFIDTGEHHHHGAHARAHAFASRELSAASEKNNLCAAVPCGREHQGRRHVFGQPGPRPRGVHAQLLSVRTFQRIENDILQRGSDDRPDLRHVCCGKTMTTLLIILAWIVIGPLVGGLLSGFDRIVTARMQSRVGPPIFQPFYDVLKLFAKQGIAVNAFQNFYMACFLVFVIITGCLFFTGGDLLLTIFSLAVAGVFFVLGAYSAHSPYSTIGAERELLQMMAYEPMLLIAAMGMYVVTKSFPCP